MKEVQQFERMIADYYNAPYAVATDSCTHAIELCLRYLKPTSTVCPTHTYLSVPMTLIKLGIPFTWSDTSWQNYYYLGNTNIIDAAVYWEEGGYKRDTFMCLSFQYKKHLNVGRGGMILVQNDYQYVALKKMSYDGRVPDVPWGEQNIDMLGYHYYMTPETAQLGMDRFQQVKSLPPAYWSYQNYPNISKMKVFQNEIVQSQ